MITLLMRLLGFWGVIDALWMAVNPDTWGKFWQKQLVTISKSQTLPRALAAIEFCASLWMFRKIDSK